MLLIITVTCCGIASTYYLTIVILCITLSVNGMPRGSHVLSIHKVRMCGLMHLKVMFFLPFALSLSDVPACKDLSWSGYR